MAVPPPDLKIPPSDNSVSVRIIDTTSWIDGISLEAFMTPLNKGFSTLSCPAFSFLIEHPKLKQKLLFDLGVRKDYENLSPRIVKRIKDGGWEVTVKQSVRDILESNGVNGSDINAIIWSHWHWDHTGDPSSFDKQTDLIVGPGFKKNFIPGYPTKQDSPLLDSDFAGREVKEISFSESLKIGNFDAHDYFGDGSFYLLNSPGHAVGHICGLARISSTEQPAGDSFILMGGDFAHHGSEFKPSQYLPLPESISPSPLPERYPTPCPGSLFESLLRDGDKCKALCAIPDLPADKAVAHDAEEARRTIAKVQEADASDVILVVPAHDASLLEVVDFFPEYVDGSRVMEWVEKGRWGFLKDYEKAVCS